MARRATSEILEMSVNWTNTDDVVSVTVFQTKYMNQLRKLAEKYPDEVKILKEAKENDGMMLAHLTKKFCKISFGEPRVKKELTEEQKAAAKENIRKAQAAKKAKAEAKDQEEEGWL